jgi:hypothetical protein
MNDYAWAGPVSALLVVVAGILACFWGYRILKVTLGLFGFIFGAYAAWELALSRFDANTAFALVCALVGGLIGMALYVWLYFLGIFLLGATAGAIVVAAVFNGSAHQPEPMVFLAASIIGGIVALIAQKLMIIVSTAFSGSYLIVAGLWPFVASHAPARIWLYPAPDSSGPWRYAALAAWLILGLVGLRVQFRSSPRKAEVADKPG